MPNAAKRSPFTFTEIKGAIALCNDLEIGLYSRLRTNQTQIFCKSPASRGFYKKSSGGFVRDLL